MDIGILFGFGLFMFLLFGLISVCWFCWCLCCCGFDVEKCWIFRLYLIVW